jgi:hypothetical protein
MCFNEREGPSRIEKPNGKNRPKFLFQRMVVVLTENSYPFYFKYELSSFTLSLFCLTAT